MFDVIYNYGKDYLNLCPRNSASAAIQSGLYSFFVSALYAGDFRVGLFGAALASTVSLISSFTAPIFKSAITNQAGKMNWYHQAVRITANIALTQLLLDYASDNLSKYITISKVNIFAGIFFTIALNLFLNGFKEQSIIDATSYILVNG